MHPLRLLAVVGAVTFATVAVGCSDLGNPSPSSPSVKRGELGNGGFTFKCDDSVACDKYNNAGTFPSRVASGSNFELQFFLRDDSAGFAFLKDAERGTTIEGVGRFVARGVSGFGAVHPGVATLAARDQKGALVDYITVQIVQPSALVVYDSEYKGESPVRVTSAVLAEGDRKSFRAVARSGGENLAGSIAVEWRSSDDTIVSVEDYTRGKATILAKGVGTARLTATAASITETIEFTVTEGPPPIDGGTDSGGDADAATDGGGQDGGGA